MNSDNEISLAADSDVEQTGEWIESLDQVVRHQGPDRGQFVLNKLIQRSHQLEIRLPFSANTPYVNSIPITDDQIHEAPG